MQTEFSLSIPLAKPPWSKLGKKLESACRKAIYDFKLFEEEPKKIVIALSGGKDSLTLLFLLHAINGKGFAPFELSCVHVGGEFSCGSSVSISYLTAICKKLDVALYIKESKQKLESLECYSCSRERRSLIFETAKSIGASTIAFGHTRDDNAETLLMNLLHKGEFAGNLPKITLYDYGVTLIRPLIYIAEKEIRSFAEMYRFARISCRCPVGQNSMRRKVDELLDEIEELFPNARENVSQAALQYGSDKANRRKSK